jgi:hypothetical protein
MKKIKGVKLFVTGLVAGILVSAGITVAATSVIRSAAFNDVAMTFNSQGLNLDVPLISVITEANPDVASNYMPARAVLEAMGYIVEWDGENNTIHVRSHWYEAARMEIPQEFAILHYLTNSLWERGIQMFWAGESIMFTSDQNITSTMGRHGETIWQYDPDKTLVFPFEPELMWGSGQFELVAENRDKVVLTFISRNGQLFVYEEEFNEMLKLLPEGQRLSSGWGEEPVDVPQEFAVISYLHNILWERGVAIAWLEDGFAFTSDVENASPTMGRHGEIIWNLDYSQSLIFRMPPENMWAWSNPPYQIAAEDREGVTLTFMNANSMLFIHEAELMEALRAVGILK